MANAMQVNRINLRDHLRANTRTDHDVTEAAFSGQDVSTLTGLAHFLTAHYAANAAVERARASLPWPRSLPSPPSALLSLGDSLAALGLRTPVAIPGLELPEPVGAAYVIAGSRFGNRLLKQQWQTCGDPIAADAGAYFNDKKLDQYARDFLASLTDYYPIDIEVTLDSARLTFQTFTNAISNLSAE